MRCLAVLAFTFLPVTIAAPASAQWRASASGLLSNLSGGLQGTEWSPGLQASVEVPAAESSIAFGGTYLPFGIPNSDAELRMTQAFVEPRVSVKIPSAAPARLLLEPRASYVHLSSPVRGPDVTRNGGLFGFGGGLTFPISGAGARFDLTGFYWWVFLGKAHLRGQAVAEEVDGGMYGGAIRLALPVG